MSKIYDALEHAQKEIKEKEKVPEPPSTSPPASTIEPTVVPTIPDMPPGVNLEAEMISLYQSIDSLLPNIPNRIIMFIGSRRGEGTTTISNEFARVAALKMGKSVLLVDIDRSRPELQHYYSVKLECDLEDVIKNNAPIEKAFCQIEDTTLFVSPIFEQSLVRPQTLDTAKTLSFWDQLRRRFDFIVIDSPPATLYADGLSIARLTDGVILIVEAEKTSWPIATTVKEKIMQHGGTLLGIVFNKRRFYIPQFIYKRL